MKLTLSDAYAELEIPHGSSVEEAKASYRKLAFKHHPDKNAGSTEASEKFQRIGAAFERVQKGEEPEPQYHHHGHGEGGYHHGEGFGGGPQFMWTDGGMFFNMGGFRMPHPGFGYRQQEPQEDEWYSDEDEEGFSADEEDEYYDFMFNNVFSGGNGTRNDFRNYRRAEPASETHEQRKERLAAEREAILRAEERRKEEAKREREAREKAREQEMAEGAARRAEKNKSKKEKSKLQAEQAAKKAVDQRQVAQDRRYAVFAAARVGDSVKVKKGVWEDNVAPDSGEWLPGFGPEEASTHSEPVAATEPTGKENLDSVKKNGKSNSKQAPKMTSPPVASPHVNGSATAPVNGNGDGKPNTNSNSAAPKKSKKKKKALATNSDAGGPTTPPTTTPPPASTPSAASVSNGKSKPALLRTAVSKKDETSRSVQKLRRTPDSKETLLHIATKNGDLDLVNWLVNHGALPEERDSASYSPFHHALSSGHVPLISYFLQNNSPPSSRPSSDDSSDPTFPTPPSTTLLTLAIASRQNEAISLIGKYCTAVEAEGGWTLMQAEESREKGKNDDQAVKKMWEGMRWALVESKVSGWDIPQAWRGRRKRQ